MEKKKERKLFFLKRVSDGGEEEIRLAVGLVSSSPKYSPL